jgi:hypothetical protein
MMCPSTRPLSRIPAAAQRVLPCQYRIDRDSNAYTVWKQMDAGGKRGVICCYR